MEKKVYVERHPRDRREFKDDRPHNRSERSERLKRHEHMERGDFRRPPRPEHPRDFDGPRAYHKHLRKPKRTQKTKLFTSKAELVDFVNEIGESGNRKIDVYKIEDDLYKVVVIEKAMPKRFEEVEIELSEDTEIE